MVIGLFSLAFPFIFLSHLTAAALLTAAVADKKTRFLLASQPTVDHNYTADTHGAEYGAYRKYRTDGAHAERSHVSV